MVFRKLLGRKCIVFCKNYGVPFGAFMHRCEQIVEKLQKRRKKYVLQQRSIFVGSRVVVKVPPYRKFRQKDRDIHRHFKWATLLWHKFNGVTLQVGDYLTKKREKMVQQKEARRNRRQTISQESQEIPKKAPAEDSSDEVQLIDNHLVINLDTDDEEQLPRPPETCDDLKLDIKIEENSFPKIVNVESAVSEQIGEFIITKVEPSEVNSEPPMEALDEMKPTNDELERARLIFSSLEPEMGMDSKEDLCSALYSLDTLSDESRSFNQTTDKTFLDSLANKLGVEGNNAGLLARADKSFEDCYQELEQTFKHVKAVASKFDDVAVKDEDTSSSSEFYGFNENDTHTPGLLKTPVVRQAGSYSAFISKKCDNLLERLGPVAIDGFERPFSRRPWDEEKINKHSLPPKLECPELPLDMKSRTLAEKKQMLRMKPVGYQVMDQENSVYQLLKKRLKAPLDDKLFDQAQRIMGQNVPMRRNVWKTATWLNTRENHYIYRYITFEGQEMKLFGCVGNYQSKHVTSLDYPPPPRNHIPTPRLWCCRITGFPRSIKFNNLREVELAEKQEIHVKDVKKEKPSDVQQTSSPIRRKWNLMETRRIPPGPLCTKPKNAEMNENLAPLDTFTLPQVVLEVWPKNNQPFPLKVKRYLSEMCPYEELSEKWIEFALATLKDVSELKQPIEFEIPYENDRRKILVSRDVHAGVPRRGRTTEHFDTDAPLTFRQDLPDDPLLEECADILEDMVNSVAIGMAEDAFSKLDPDLNYEKRDSQKRFLEAPKDQEEPAFKRPRSSALLSELKRLNATIISTENIQRQKECNQEHCKMGCICDSIATLSCPTGHCEDLRCMFECVCGKGLVIKNKNINPFSKEVFRMRDKAISRLARAEKDFSSTVVLTNNNTFLLSNSTEEKSKRSRTVPRKFGDYVRTEVEEEEVQKNDTADVPVKYPSVKGKRGRRQIDPEIEKMRHVSVVLTPIGRVVQQMEPWCMVHELYRCFCKGEARDGKPFLLTKIDENYIAMSEEIVAKPSDYKKAQKKAKFSYETEPPRDISFIVSEFDSPTASTLSTNQIPQFVSPAVPEIDADDAIIEDYLQNIQKARVKMYKRGELTAHIFRGSVSRCVAFDKSTQVILNRQNARRVKKFIYAMERTPKILSLLKKRYTDSVSKSKNEIEWNVRAPLPENFLQSDPITTPTQQSYSEDVAYSEIIHSLEATAATEQGSSSTADPVVPVISSVTSLNESELSNSSFADVVSTPAENDVRKNLLDKLNLMVSKMMTTIAKNEEKLMLDIPQVNKITTIKWINLLQSYRSYMLHIWEVHYADNVHMIITRSNKKPDVPAGYHEILEVRKLKRPNSIFGRMLVKAYDLASIDKLAALLFGHSNYWQVIGFLNKPPNPQAMSLSAKYLAVSKETHPDVAKKISRLYDMLLSKVKTSVKVPTSNVQLMTSDQIKDANLLKFPLPSQSGQRWYMLVITNDFSDISHPKWGQLLSYDRIRYAIEIAEKNGRTVQVKSNNSTSLNPSVYVTPHESDKIFIGPYGTSEECDIVLYQRMDGNILLRETYEKITNIKRTSTTKGCWIQMKPRENCMRTPSLDRESIMDLDGDVSDKKTPDDEDCIVVEADPKEIKAAEEAHEAEKAVNSILPDGLKFPTQEPKKLSGNHGDPATSDVGRIRVIPNHVLQARASPEISDDAAPPKKRQRRSVKEDTPLAKLKDLTVFPMGDDDATPEWAVSAANVPSMTITSVEEIKSSNFPVISKVMSLGEDEKQAPQKSLLKNNYLQPGENKAASQETLDLEKNLKLTPYEKQFAEYLENNPTSFKVLPVQSAPSRTLIKKNIAVPPMPHSSEVQQRVQVKKPENFLLSQMELDTLYNSVYKNNETPKIPKVRIVKSIKPPPLTATSVVPAQKPSEAGSIQEETYRLAYTADGKKVIIRQVAKNEIKPGPLKRVSLPPLALATKKLKLDEQDLEKMTPITHSSTPAPLKINNLMPSSTNSCVKIGQTMLQKVSATATSSTLGGKTTAGIVYNGLGSQTLKMNVAPGSSEKVNLPKSIVKPVQLLTKAPTTLTQSLPGSSMSTIVAPSSAAVKIPSASSSSLLDTSKTITITRTTVGGKAIKIVLPVSSIQPLYKVPSSTVPPLHSTTSTITPTVAEKTSEDIQNPSEGDIIDLSDDEDEMRQKFGIQKEKITNGWIVPSIPQLGYIPTRMVDKTNYLMELPTRKHPFKVGCNCVDRYMDRYMKYCVSMYLPEDLSVRWEFVEGDPQKQQPGEKFTLQASTNKDRLILTPNGVMDMEFPVQRELIDCPSVYTRLLLMHLIYVSVGELKPTKGIEIVEKAVNVIKELKESSQELTLEMQKQNDRHRELTLRSKILNEALKLPTTAK